MSKISKNESKSDSTNFAYQTVIRSVILAGLFLVLSFIFNGEIIKIYDGTNDILIILVAVFKVSLILIFFIFSVISIGNYKELSGKPLNLKDILLLCAISLIQAFRDPIVLVFTLFGLGILLVYFYISQES
jgi:hypothetical protein